MYLVLLNYLPISVHFLFFEQVAQGGHCRGHLHIITRSGWVSLDERGSVYVACAETLSKKVEKVNLDIFCL
jgi:hypothetical protein